LKPTYPSDVPLRVDGQSKKFGKALSFDGSNDYVLSVFNANDVIEDDDPFTMEAWIKNPNTDTLRTIVSWGEHLFNKDRSLWLYTNTGVLCLYFYPTTTNMVSGTSDLRDNKWHYVAGTWDGSLGRVYVDGILENSGSLTADAYTYADTRIGENISSSYRYLGLIDDVRIYNRTLSPTEIMKHYELLRRPNRRQIRLV